MYSRVLSAGAASPLTYQSPLQLNRGYSSLPSTSFQSSLQDKQKSSTVKSVLLLMAAGAGIGAGIGGYVTLATGLSEHSNRGDFCNVEKGVPSLKCTLLGAAIGGSAATLLGLASSESEPPSSIKLGVTVGMIGVSPGCRGWCSDRENSRN